MPLVHVANGAAGLGLLPFAVFSPLVAAGGAAVAVALPVVIHLLFRKRYQVVPWAAVRFLVVNERRSRRRVEQWALLAVRALVVLVPLLAMAAATPWAEPLWQAVRAGELEVVGNVPRTHHVLVIDGSLSMSARAGDRTRFDHALRQAEELVRAGRPGDGFTLVSLDGPPVAVVPRPANDPDKVVAELHALAGSHAPADPAAALALVADVLARSPRAYPRRQVTIFTDLQRSAWGPTLPRSEAGAPGPWRVLAGKADVALVDAADADPDNLAVVNVAVSDPLPLVGGGAVVTAAVQNFGRTARGPVGVKLEVVLPEGATRRRPLDRAAEDSLTRRIDTVAPGEQATVSFVLDGPLRFEDRGLHVLRVRLADGDGLAADDVRSLVVDVRDGLNVVLVDGRADPEPLRRAAGFLSRALAPPGGRAGDSQA